MSKQTLILLTVIAVLFFQFTVAYFQPVPYKYEDCDTGWKNKVKWSEENWSFSHYGWICKHDNHFISNGN